MGYRGLRLGFKYYDKLLKPQLRALIRLSLNYNIKILCPMISDIDDIKEIKKALINESDDLKLNMAEQADELKGADSGFLESNNLVTKFVFIL